MGLRAAQPSHDQTDTRADLAVWRISLSAPELAIAPSVRRLRSCLMHVSDRQLDIAARRQNSKILRDECKVLDPRIPGRYVRAKSCRIRRQTPPHYASTPWNLRYR